MRGMFADAAVTGAVFVAVLALNAEIANSEELRRFLTQSPLITVAAALGIGALIELTFDALRTRFYWDAMPADLVRSLPAYTAMKRERSWDLASRPLTGFSREHLRRLAADYHFRSEAPAALVDYVDHHRARARMMSLITLTVLQATIVAFVFVYDGTLETVVPLVAVVVVTRLSDWLMAERLHYAAAVQEHFLRASIGGGPRIDEYRGSYLKFRGPLHLLRLRRRRRKRRMRQAARR